MVKYENEFGDVKKKKRTTVSVSHSVLRDLKALRAYSDEPINCVIERLMQSMHPKDMTEAIVKKVRKADAKMGIVFSRRLSKKYKKVHDRQLSRKDWVEKLYDDAMRESGR